MYTLQQQVFALSFFSNAASNHTGNVAQLEAGAKSAIGGLLTNPVATAQIGSSWRIVWGPVVFQEAGSTDADNVMLVYQGTSGGNPVYVVAIAGTNGLSQFDVSDEDLDVGTTVPFSNGGAWISKGTSDGVKILEAMVDPAGGALQPFLASKAASNATLIFTGHSLGGALAPTLALNLVVNRGFDVTKWANVFVYPSAGPTPGNQAFSSLFGQTFPQQPPAGAAAWNAWNMDVVNTMDIVPRAWSQLPTLPTLYPALGGLAQSVVQGIVVALTLKDNLNANVYAVLPTSSFPGQYNSDPPPAPRIPLVLRGVPRYFTQAYYQHIRVYLQAVIPELTSLFEVSTPALSKIA